MNMERKMPDKNKNIPKPSGDYTPLSALGDIGDNNDDGTSLSNAQDLFEEVISKNPDALYVLSEVSDHYSQDPLGGAENIITTDQNENPLYIGNPANQGEQLYGAIDQDEQPDVPTDIDNKDNQNPLTTNGQNKTPSVTTAKENKVWNSLKQAPPEALYDLFSKFPCYEGLVQDRFEKLKVSNPNISDKELLSKAKKLVGEYDLKVIHSGNNEGKRNIKSVLEKITENDGEKIIHLPSKSAKFPHIKSNYNADVALVYSEYLTFILVKEQSGIEYLYKYPGGQFFQKNNPEKTRAFAEEMNISNNLVFRNFAKPPAIEAPAEVAAAIEAPAEVAAAIEAPAVEAPTEVAAEEVAAAPAVEVKKAKAQQTKPVSIFAGLHNLGFKFKQTCIGQAAIKNNDDGTIVVAYPSDKQKINISEQFNCIICNDLNELENLSDYGIEPNVIKGRKISIGTLEKAIDGSPKTSEAGVTNNFSM
jgi:hypothetical protein